MPPKTPFSCLEGLTGPNCGGHLRLARLGRKCLQTARTWTGTTPGKHPFPALGLRVSGLP